jgi:cysteine synthase A
VPIQATTNAAISATVERRHRRHHFGLRGNIKPRKPPFQTIAVEPKDSPVISQALAAQPVKPGPHKIHLHLKNECGEAQITECNDDAFAMARRLAKEEDILAGISSGANAWAAFEVARRPENNGKLIVTVACSTGERYLTPLAEEGRKEVSA